LKPTVSEPRSYTRILDVEEPREELDKMFELNNIASLNARD
jgi:hypothetical protein